MRPLLSIYLVHPQVSCWQMTPQESGLLAERMPEFQVLHCRSQEEFRCSLRQAQIGISWKFQQDWLEKAENLRLIATPAAGQDYFDIELPEHIQAWNGSFHGEIMAETALGALLGVSRGLFSALGKFSQLPWPRAELSGQMRPLKGSHVGLLGFGNIGQCIGRLLKPFEVRLSAMRRDLQRPKPAWFKPGDRLFTPAELERELPGFDHLVLCLPRCPETDMIINRKRLALLHKEASIYNFGRGNALDLEALQEALQAGRLKAAFLDVFPEEPVSAGADFLRCPNLWRLPHLSAAAPNYMRLFIEEFVRRYREQDTKSH
ncbi:MAG: NAD(P)-dependent oxidoreductase [Lentisphaeria bacterium]|nr:NAD(P)-dependent oxidoreductase [Lentisphaeria bacterium]